jgi:hypothetical protein
MFEVIVDGMEYQAKQKVANRPTSSPATTIVKPSQVVKPGSQSQLREDKESQLKVGKAQDALRKSGRPKDATDLLKRYL